MATPHSSDVAAKRASTTTDPVAENEEAASSVMEKARVEEEDDGDCNSEGRRVVWNHLSFIYVPEKEPEWDVDSQEGREYETDPEDRKYFSDEEEYQKFRRLKHDTFNSKGFLPDVENGIYTFGRLDAPANKNMTNREMLTDLASLCIEKLNKEERKTVELDSVVRATVSGGGRWKIYITIMAREYENGPLVEYQAKVMRFAGNYRPPFPILCRPTPKPTII